MVQPVELLAVSPPLVVLVALAALVFEQLCQDVAAAAVEQEQVPFARS